MFKHVESYIDTNIFIDEKLPENVLAIIREMESYDKHCPELYFDRVDDIDVIAKNAYTDGLISKYTWEKIEKKYIFHAISVANKEDAHANIDLSHP